MLLHPPSQPLAGFLPQVTAFIEADPVRQAQLEGVGVATEFSVARREPLLQSPPLGFQWVKGIAALHCGWQRFTGQEPGWSGIRRERLNPPLLAALS